MVQRGAGSLLVLGPGESSGFQTEGVCAVVLVVDAAPAPFAVLLRDCFEGAFGRQGGRGGEGRLVSRVE